MAKTSFIYKTTFKKLIIFFSIYHDIIYHITNMLFKKVGFKTLNVRFLFFCSFFVVYC